MSKKLYEEIISENNGDNRGTQLNPKQDPYYGYGKADFEKLEAAEKSLLQSVRGKHSHFAY